jgi:hypothetical protein
MIGRTPVLKASVVVLLAAGLTSNCNTPQIPLPPPLIESFTVAVDTAKSQVTISSTGTITFADATIYVINQRTGDGFIRRADSLGAFQGQPIAAVDRDRFSLQYEVQGELSDALCAEVRFDAGALTSCK